MASQVPTTYVTKYSSNMRMALNQQGSLLAAAAMEETGSGEIYQLTNIVGNGAIKERSTRDAIVVADDPKHDRVWVERPNQKYDADKVDVLDKVASGIELTGAYTMKHAGTIRRAWDATFLVGSDGTGGFYGNMLMGKRGETIVPFPTGNIVPVSTGAAGPTGLNIPKILAAREILATGYVNMDQEWFMAVTANEVTDLFGQVQVTSGDFEKSWKPRFSADGKKLLGLAGFTFVEIELSNPLLGSVVTSATIDGNGYRNTPFWTKDGMTMVPWADQKLVSTIDEIPEQFRTKQILTTTMMQATRTDNARVGIIKNN